MFLSEWREFRSAPCLAGKKRDLMTTRVSMLMKTRASPTCFRACFPHGRAKDLLATQYAVHYLLLKMYSFIRLRTSELKNKITLVNFFHQMSYSVHLRSRFQNPARRKNIDTCFLFFYFSGVSRRVFG